MAALEIIPVTSGKLLNEFLKFPWAVYKGDPNWVPPMLYSLRTMFDTAKFPFHFHSEVQAFLCRYASGKPAGRICAVYNRRHLEIHGDGVGFFGFFEAFDDADVACCLFDAASGWLKERGCTSIRGPANFSLNEECGLLVDGLDVPPVLMMPYNPSYYRTLLENAGFRKAMDIFAYLVKAEEFSSRFERAANLLKRRFKAEVRPIDLGNLDAEMELFFDIYNRAWEKNWGFVPMTREEFFFGAREFAKMADPSLVLILEVDGSPVGFSMALPDYNVPMKHMNGRLYPFGFLKFLLYRKKIKMIRVVALGILKEFRGKGLDALMYHETARKAQEKGYTSAEFSWILETNKEMNLASEKTGARRYKTYRFYEREI